MKVAIIGGNLTGAATAYCLQEVAAANRARRRAAGAAGADEEMEVRAAGVGTVLREKVGVEGNGKNKGEGGWGEGGLLAGRRCD